MMQRRDTDVTRHTGGWIVLGAGLLVACGWGTWRREAISVPGTARPQGRDGSVSRAPLLEFPRLSIDINQADEAELSCIAGIGPALARRIVDHRQRVGRFTSMSQLESVPGVGPALSRQLRSALQPLSETESDIAAADSARLAGRQTKLPINELLHD